MRLRHSGAHVPRARTLDSYRSDDQGKSWQSLTGGIGESLYGAPRCIAIDPKDPDTVAIGSFDGTVFLTEDGGESFRKTLENLDGWVTALQFIN